ncbi:helix-turn-helix domain-containing protein [Paenibacillus sp. RC84]|uniref:helix-turn-helix domain-containing protein n=1 Tax=Paenibacillus sp. RC84 TaxID=3156252 RepID=UPI00351522F9
MKDILKDTKRRHIPYTKFKAFLGEYGVSQGKLGELLGKSPSAINQNLNGTGGDFTITEIRKICAAFEISADEYFICPGVSKEKQNTA